MKTESILDESGLRYADLSKPKKCNFKKCAILVISVCLIMTVSLLTLLFFAKDFWKQIPEKVYDVEYKFFNNGEKTTVLMEIDPRNKIETFRTENGTDNAVEIHDFKHGITGIYFAELQKCFIKTQSTEIPEIEESALVEFEEDAITSTVYEESMLWVPAERPIEDKEFMKNSRIFEICKNVTTHWIYPSTPTATEFLDFDDREDQTDEKQNKRPSRSLTEEDLPINDYREAGLQMPPMYDHRGYCCHHCRRGQRYCQRVCEPLLGYYPYPYCYGSGRVHCRIIMPCNWWVARMLGRV